MFVKYFIKFSYVFLSSLLFLIGKLEKNSTHVVSFVFDYFLGNVLREMNTTTLVVWLMKSISRFSVGFGLRVRGHETHATS